MTISSILAGLIINAASLALARKLIFVSIDMETAAPANDVYQPRNPRSSDYFKCTQAHFEQLEMLWDDRYQQRYGFWRPYVMDVINRYLDCGDLHCGFARVKCYDCNHEILLPFSCKRRHFCPTCHQKRVVVFGEELCENVLKYVPHRQWVFSIPKRLRIYFMFDRKLLSKLSQCVWKVLSVYLIFLLMTHPMVRQRLYMNPRMAGPKRHLTP